MSGKIFCIMLAAALLGAAPCQAGNDVAAAANLREKATVVHRTDFVVDAPIVVWNKLMDHLVLMGKLWNMYHFQPAYDITAAEKGVRVTDPSGINGEMVLIDASATSRTFHCRGHIDHWAVPSFISAEGIFVFRYEDEDGQRIRGKFEVFLRGENEIADFLLGLAAGKLKRRLQNRFTNNMEDVKKIIHDLHHQPDQIRSGLAGPALKEFNALF